MPPYQNSFSILNQMHSRQYHVESEMPYPKQFNPLNNDFRFEFIVIELFIQN